MPVEKYLVGPIETLAARVKAYMLVCYTSNLLPRPEQVSKKNLPCSPTHLHEICVWMETTGSRIGQLRVHVEVV